MRAFVNELALAESCAEGGSTHTPLEALLEARQKLTVFRHALYCTRNMLNTEVRADLTLGDIGRRLSRDKVGVLFRWLANSGPFMDDDRLSVDDDLFHLFEFDVTNLGIGEAARRTLASDWTALLSLVHDSNSRFSDDPLRVVQGLAEEPVGAIDLPNYVCPTSLAEALSSAHPPATTWEELLNICRRQFDRLVIGDHCNRILTRQPFNPAAGRMIREQLRILQQLMTEMNDSGELSTAGVEIRNRYFVGERAWFSSESETRKHDATRFTFPDPIGKGALVCFWHGKISTPVLRMHFEWPVEQPSQGLRVVYIGPHL